MMEAVEFMREYDRMCRMCSDCNKCPAGGLECCEPESTEECAKLVEIVEKWAKEHSAKVENEAEVPSLSYTVIGVAVAALGMALTDYDRINALEPCDADDIKSVINDVLDICEALFAEMSDEKRSMLRTVTPSLYDFVTIWLPYYEKTKGTTPALTQTPAPEPTSKLKQKRTRKDLMLAAFPDTEIVDGYPPFCPIHFEKGFRCRDTSGGIPCNNCKREYWLTEVEE